MWSDDRNWVTIYSSATDQRTGGVGVKSVSQRILTATFNGNPQLTTVYAQTESATDIDKDEFYDSLKQQ